MFVQSKLKRGRAATEVAESRSAGSAASTKVDYKVDEVEPAASPSLIEDGKRAMKRLAKAMASVCSIHDVDFRNLVEEHELSAGEDFAGKVGFVLADPPYDVRRNLMAPNTEYDVFGVKDMKDMAKSPGDMTKPGPMRTCSVHRSSLPSGTRLQYLNVQKSVQLWVEMPKIRYLEAERAKKLGSRHFQGRYISTALHSCCWLLPANDVCIAVGPYVCLQNGHTLLVIRRGMG